MATRHNVLIHHRHIHTRHHHCQRQEKEQPEEVTAVSTVQLKLNLSKRLDYLCDLDRQTYEDDDDDDDDLRQ